MIITARQIEDLHRQNGVNGHVTVPYRARLTPLAADWVKSKRVVLGYSDVAAGQADGNGKTVANPQPNNADSAPSAPPVVAATSATTLPFLWWCDGPCGPGKAALIAQEKESSLRALDLPADARQIVAVIKRLAADVKAGRGAGGVLLVQNGALAVVYANRCPSLRAVLGTCLEAVEQGVQLVAANVLVIEYPYKTLQQMKNLLSRFTRGGREVPEEVRRQLQELTTCG